MTATHQFCTFRLDGMLFGLEVRRVQEVLRAQALTPVPLAPGVVEGLINLRGDIVTALDLRRRLGLAERPGDETAMNVVVRTADNEELVSLLVDEIGDVVETDDAAFESPPETLQGSARELVHGAYKLEEDLLLLLDVERAVALAA